MGLQEPDRGEVSHPKDHRIGYLPQELTETWTDTVLHEVMRGAGDVLELEAELRRLETAMGEEAGPEHDRAVERYGVVQSRYETLGGYQIEADARRILGGLGFTTAGHGPATAGDVRGLADAGRAGPAPPPESRCPGTGRADEPPRRRLGGLARATAGLLAGGHPVRLPRPGLHRRRRRAGDRDRLGHLLGVRRRVRRVRGGQGGAAGLARGGGRSTGQGDRAGRTLHRAVPLQGDQGPPGPVQDQDPGEAGADRGAEGRRPEAQVRLPGAAPLVEAGHRDHRRRHGLPGRRRRHPGAERRRPGGRAGSEAGPGRSERRREVHPAADHHGSTRAAGRYGQARGQRRCGLLRPAPCRRPRPRPDRGAGVPPQGGGPAEEPQHQDRPRLVRVLG